MLTTAGTSLSARSAEASGRAGASAQAGLVNPRRVKPIRTLRMYKRRGADARVGDGAITACEPNKLSPSMGMLTRPLAEADEGNTLPASPSAGSHFPSGEAGQAPKPPRGPREPGEGANPFPPPGCF